MSDRWLRRLQRWMLLGLILGFACLLAASYAGLAFGSGRSLPLLAGQSRRDLLMAAVIYACWIVGRPLIIVSRRPHPPPPGDGSRDGASVVIPCCNAAHLIGDTVETILAQTYRPIEVILVENNSTDDTWRLCQELERRHPGVVRAARVDVYDWEYACSVAINVGVQQARYESIIRMDCDTIMSPTMIEEALRELNRSGTSAVAVNLRLANPTASIITRLQSIEYLLAMELDRRFQVLFGSVVCCSGGLSAYLRSTIVDSGGFCSAPKWVSEDLDMTMKAHRLGYVRMAPGAIGFTWAPEDVSGIFRQRVRWGTTGIVAFYLHHRGIGRRSYWFDGRIGFFGLPLLGVIKLRDAMAFTYVVVALLAVLHGGWQWLLVFAVARILAVTAQLLFLLPFLRNRHGATSAWLVPVFICLYGPLMLVARCVGAWRGVVDIRRLRKQIVVLEHAGLDPQHHLARGLETGPVPVKAGDIDATSLAKTAQVPRPTDEPALVAATQPPPRPRPPAGRPRTTLPERIEPGIVAGAAIALVAVAARWTLRRRAV
jgi:cellulose synthase/poly-beta-1,6-N-acetylglucosamine synthase-like glycosyltransferase